MFCALLLSGVPAVTVPAHAQYFALGKGGAPLEPYDVDYSALSDPAKRLTALDHLHFVPLGGSNVAYLTLDGELREQGWVNNATYGLRTPLRNSYDLQRALVSASIHADDHLAAFVQIGRFDSFARVSPSTTERDEGRVQQAFVDVKERVGDATIDLRGGRQEIALGSGRFVWLNDSSNVRTTHDGVRAAASFSDGGSLDLVYTRPVTPVLVPFDDFDQHAGAFGAAYYSRAIHADMHVDTYYFYRRNLGGQYSGLTGNEERSTMGGRVWGAIGPLKYDADFAYQVGSFSARPISAFGGSLRALYTVQAVNWQPGLQLQTSYFSGGGGSASGTIRTFSAPFPRPTMLNYIGLNTLENLVEIYPAIVLAPVDTVSFRFGPEFLWRASVDDAVYVSRSTPLAATMSARDKASFIGTNLVATVQWDPVKNVSVFAEVLEELPGPAITLAGGRAVHAGVVQVSFKF